jgi:hypothetical protein
MPKYNIIKYFLSAEFFLAIVVGLPNKFPAFHEIAVFACAHHLPPVLS